MGWCNSAVRTILLLRLGGVGERGGGVGRGHDRDVALVALLEDGPGSLDGPTEVAAAVSRVWQTIREGRAKKVLELAGVCVCGGGGVRPILVVLGADLVNTASSSKPAARTAFPAALASSMPSEVSGESTHLKNDKTSSKAQVSVCVHAIDSQQINNVRTRRIFGPNSIHFAHDV
jgi:hypothetical protein